ncbi:MAG: hypothetical protein ACRDZR_15815 [Acidimicrobiales bacterium]
MAVPERVPATSPLPTDPTVWRSAAELDRRAQELDRRLARVERDTRPRPVMDDATWQAANARDHEAAAEARERAAGHREEVARMEAGRPALVRSATDDFLAAHEAARTIEDGPGRFRHRAGRVDDAHALRRQVAARWFGHQLPGARRSDEAVRSAAAEAADRTLARHLDHHRRAAARDERGAARLDGIVAARDEAQHEARRVNELGAATRQRRMAPIEQDREELDHDRGVRAERTATMAPVEIDAADAARDTYLTTETISHVVEASIAPGRIVLGPTVEPPTMEPPGIEMDGPGPEL